MTKYNDQSVAGFRFSVESFPDNQATDREPEQNKPVLLRAFFVE